MEAFPSGMNLPYSFTPPACKQLRSIRTAHRYNLLLGLVGVCCMFLIVLRSREDGTIPTVLNVVSSPSPLSSTTTARRWVFSQRQMLTRPSFFDRFLKTISPLQLISWSYDSYKKRFPGRGSKQVAKFDSTGMGLERMDRQEPRFFLGLRLHHP